MHDLHNGMPCVLEYLLLSGAWPNYQPLRIFYKMDNVCFFCILDDGVTIRILRGDAHEFIDLLIQKEISKGKYIFSHTKPYNVDAIGVVPKSNHCYRPITDCKRPLLSSVNNYLNETHQQFTFSTVDDITY